MPRSLLGRIGLAAAAHKWTVLSIWGIAFLIALPFAPQIATALKPGGFGSNDMESVRAGTLLQDRLGAHFTSVQIFFSSSTLSVQNPQFVAEATAALAPLQHWSEVNQIIDFTTNPRQISNDTHSAYTTVYLNIDADNAPSILPTLEKKLVKPANLAMVVGGGPVFYADIQKVSEDDLRRAELLAFPIATIALLLVFRSIVAAAVPAVVGGFSVVVSLAIIFALASHTTISIFALNITTLFGLGLGVDYSLFMVNRFREELARGASVHDAIQTTMETAGRAVSVSAIAVSIGLLGLLLFNFTVLRSIGIGGVLVVLISLLSAMTLLPALLAILGTHINDFRVRLPWRTASSAKDGANINTSGFWHSLAVLVMRYPWQFLVPVLIVLLLLGTPFLNVRLGAPDASILPQTVPSRAAYNLLQTKFDAAETDPIILAVTTHQGDALQSANLDNLDALVLRLQQDPRVRRVDSIITADPQLSLTQIKYLLADPQHISDPYLARVAKVFATGNLSLVNIVSKYSMIDPRSEALVQDIRATRFTGLNVLVTGGTAGVVDYVNTLYSQFPIAIGMVALTTFVVLMILFRSILLPLKALAMNTLSILSAYGALVFIFQEGHLSGLLNFSPLGFVEASAPILMFCALFGLSMDYEVFLLTRVREEYLKTQNNEQSVAIGMERSGAIISSAAAIVVIVSGGFVSADMILVKALGVGMALAVFMDATLVRGLLVPATMRLLGDWNWWWPFQRAQTPPPEGQFAATPDAVAIHD